jgi:hypothetical protein
MIYDLYFYILSSLYLLSFFIFHTTIIANRNLVQQILVCLFNQYVDPPLKVDLSANPGSSLSAYEKVTPIMLLVESNQKLEILVGAHPFSSFKAIIDRKIGWKARMRLRSLTRHHQ